MSRENLNINPISLDLIDDSIYFVNVTYPSNGTFKKLNRDTGIISKRKEKSKHRVRVKTFNELGWKKTIRGKYVMGWVQDMDNYIGKEFIVNPPDCCTLIGNNYSIGGYTFHEDWVEVLVN